VLWSISLSMSTMARSAVSRRARPGCMAGKAANWARMSGEALNSTQSTPFALTVMEDWVRGWARSLPWRMRRQLLQLQFLCGMPPPIPVRGGASVASAGPAIPIRFPKLSV
jgi:hypothetical protein